jgi:hypothetical protein
VVIFPESVSRAISLIMARNPILDEEETISALEVKPKNWPKFVPVTAASNGKPSIG